LNSNKTATSFGDRIIELLVNMAFKTIAVETFPITEQ